MLTWVLLQMFFCFFLRFLSALARVWVYLQPSVIWPTILMPGFTFISVAFLCVALVASKQRFITPKRSWPPEQSDICRRGAEAFHLEMGTKSGNPHWFTPNPLLFVIYFAFLMSVFGKGAFQSGNSWQIEIIPDVWQTISQFTRVKAGEMPVSVTLNFAIVQPIKGWDVRNDAISI